MLTFACQTCFGAELPDQARAALQKLFPDAKVLSADTEKESGALYYDVEIKQGTRKIDVEVSPEGVIGEVECQASQAELPAAVAKTAKSIPQVVKIEKHERHGSARSGTWMSLSKVTTYYEIKHREKGRIQSILLNIEGKLVADPDDEAETADDNDEESQIPLSSLPQAVTSAIQS